MELHPSFFFVFLIVVVTLNYFFSARYRPLFILLASIIFIGYLNLPSLIVVLFFSLINFYLAKNITGKKFKFLAALSLNISAIIFFNFFNSSTQGPEFEFHTAGFNIPHFIVSIGLSFYSLQNIAYITDIYFKRALPQTSILNFFLYNSFFTKVISGPIMSPNEFMAQINSNKPSSEMISSGINRFVIGLLKKMVIADGLYPAVHAIFDSSNNYNGITTLIGVYLFTIQLYFDFSGYTDMALGTAKMLGYNLKENFNLPFRSTSITEFWRRWHISLINWFTNYIYYPIVYYLRAYKKIAVFIGIAATFLVSAIWHGLNFTFLLWAFCFIIYMSFELLTKAIRTNISRRFPPLVNKLFSIFIVFNGVCFSNIFFRSESAIRAFLLMKNILSNFIPANWLSDFVAPLANGGNLMEQFNFLITLLLMSFLLLFERTINKKATALKIDILYISICVMLIMIFGVFNNTERFIYMQF